MEGDAAFGGVSMAELLFQSTPSAWRVTIQSPGQVPGVGFQSTPSAWRVTGWRKQGRYSITISIHTLRMEGDFG